MPWCQQQRSEKSEEKLHQVTTQSQEDSAKSPRSQQWHHVKKYKRSQLFCHFHLKGRRVLNYEPVSFFSFLSLLDLEYWSLAHTAHWPWVFFLHKIVTEEGSAALRDHVTGTNNLNSPDIWGGSSIFRILVHCWPILLSPRSVLGHH